MTTLYKYLVAGLLLIGFGACKKELSALPQNAKVDANTILDQGTAQIALNGAYYTFANATAVKTGWQMHEVFPARFAGHLTFGVSTGYNEDLNLNARTTSYYWAESYILLNSANGVIKGVTALADHKFSANRKQEILAEARFLRAYAHFKLLVFYGEWYKVESPYGVLLRDELSTLSNIAKARSSVKESYNFILADLDAVIANGPAVNPRHYATKWAGMALKMRVLMSRGAAGDYAEVVNLANTLIQTGPYVLETNARDVFRTAGLTSKEVILGIIPQVGQEKATFSKSLQYWPGASSLYAATAALNNLYANDPRQTWVIGPANPSTRVPNTFFFTKYIAQSTTPTLISEASYALRLTEVYLLKAEAIVRSGGSLADAKALIHTVQEKAGITSSTNNINYLAVEAASTPETLLAEIYKETVKSLVAEDGQEWLALLRQPFATVRQLRHTITTQEQYILPVPRSEFMYNPSFGEQNPGYSKN
ncbi:RagB/SusD family nutrient uptake outer membrane protein [Pedobacter sp. MC2016-14]|uniref:RagB/SusD family nutrient uptake outer membrane protein n=1 Tax=Pedobacter sp. MC2016-14 TaxID=2897327 RepID=UPI001E2A064C|nr:RagB/SusD family nutrient uptake outer membrane protein [Pedobacter sp. MC2016-14]MCD0490400.1 RagB/SusD family nutrient uptake outer membrane protein [Pedobacter sp. MC2016-14]